MANITGKKALFFVTSPRTPIKMVEEIKLLTDNFSGKPWNAATQEAYYTLLTKQEFFAGQLAGDLAFKARDRINRGPQTFGFVDLYPLVRLTDVGKEYIYGKRQEEVFLKQMLKVQFPSPYHIDNNATYAVKPYLEMIRLVTELGGISKTEIGLFGIQLIHYQRFSDVKKKIEKFRNQRKSIREKGISYSSFLATTFETELKQIFSEEIQAGEIAIRENEGVSLEQFLRKKRANHMDYADAAIRYLKSTKLLSYKPIKDKVEITTDKLHDIEYILQNVDRKPLVWSNEDDYKEYLFDTANLSLLVDNRNNLINKLGKYKVPASRTMGKGIEALKDLLDELQKQKVGKIIDQEVVDLEGYKRHDEIDELYKKIKSKEIVDLPLYLEWNTWRAFTMLDDGKIQGNFVVNDEGMPLYVAPGNKPDIECKYSNFYLIVEVTLSSGQRQYEMEGEPVARHLGDAVKANGQDTYCVFIASNVSPATAAHFFTLHKYDVAHYGGRAKIIPLELEDFQTLISNANDAKTKPTADDLKNFVQQATDSATTAKDEIEWIAEIKSSVKTAFTT